LADEGAYRPNQLGVFVAHQMGSARMTSKYVTGWMTVLIVFLLHQHVTPGPVSPTGETWEVQNLFVCDASIFPTSSGVNPMVTCYAMATLVSEQIAKKAKKTSSKL
jgi:choline dehydrogenase-like flavoprotein